MNSSPISVILPNYNHARYIGRQLNALLSQSVRPLEVIVIDDGSTDDSVEVIGRFAKDDPIVRLVRNERNLGVIATVIRALKECQGDFVTGVAADDVVAPGCFERIMRLIDGFPQAGIYFGQLQAMYQSEGASDFKEGPIFKASRWTEETYASPESFLNDYLEVEPCYHSPSASTVYRKRCFEEIGGYRAELGHWADTFALRAIGLKYGACYTPSVQAYIYGYTDSFGASQWRNLKLSLDIVARAAWLMRSPEFRDRFPEPHVARWEKDYRNYVMTDLFSATYQPLVRKLFGLPPDGAGPAGWSPSWWRQLWTRLVLSYHWRRTQAYAPDLSCYAATCRKGG
jgi:glycosyltransferase involved in cell wall biosynthesis